MRGLSCAPWLSIPSCSSSAHDRTEEKSSEAGPFEKGRRGTVRKDPRVDLISRKRRGGKGKNTGLERRRRTGKKILVYVRVTNEERRNREGAV